MARLCKYIHAPEFAGKKNSIKIEKNAQIFWVVPDHFWIPVHKKAEIWKIL